MSRRLGNQRKESLSAQRSGCCCVGPLYSLLLISLYLFLVEFSQPLEEAASGQDWGEATEGWHMSSMKNKLPNGTSLLFSLDVLLVSFMGVSKEAR